MWRVRMDGGMDGFTFDGGDAAEDLCDALNAEIEVCDPIWCSEP